MKSGWVAVLFALLLVGALLRSRVPDPRAMVKSGDIPAPNEAGPIVSPLPAAEPARARRWPPEEQALDTAVAPPRPTLPKAVPTKAPELLPVSQEDLLEIHRWDLADPEVPGLARLTLFDERRAPGLKLAALNRVRRMAADVAVPILEEFLLDPDPAGGSATKPTAVAYLFDIDDPRARQALGRIQAQVRDPAILAALEACQKKGSTR